MFIRAQDAKGIEHNVDFRLLEQRSRLEFTYPRASSDGGPAVVFIPFFENPVITESKSANYAEYDVLGRSSTLYAYTGAKSRKIKLELQYTLHHLLAMSVTQSRFVKMLETEEDAKKKFFDIGENNSTIKRGQAQELHDEYRRIFGDVHGDATLLDRFEDFQQLNQQQTLKVIDTMLFFVNVLRSSVYNNASNPLFGPPIVRLKHGTMYQDVPCIVKNYDIGGMDEAGYHLETLTPNRLKVTLTLDEIRASDFGKYERALPVSRDNLAGWESVIGESAGSLDPGGLL